jgi:molecular chaperone GrpE
VANPEPIQSPAETGDAADNGAALVDELNKLRAELDDARDRTLRAQAELDNFRKRSRRELEDERRYANAPLLRDLLPVLDNMGRAIQAAEKSPDPASLLEGFKMLKQQLESALARHHCVEIPAAGQAFDPNLHSAISSQPSREHAEHTILHVAQPGYKLHDRVIRPSQVIVSTRPIEGA